jgi:deoxyribonuclease V
MLVCLDVDYRDNGAVAAGLLFREWADDRPTSESVVPIDRVQPYEPGQFYRRELPCLLAVLETFDIRPEVVIIDGYVWLGDEHDPGLGGHLHRAVDGKAAVIGVAKTRFLRARLVEEVHRGSSRAPLYVTAVGIDLSEAARHIREMHGPHRIPTLLKRVDRLCRDHPLSERPDVKA